MEVLLAILIIVGVILYDSFSYGFVLYKYWYWFVMPAFESAASLTFLQCVGLALVIDLFKSKDFKEDDRNTDYVALVVAPWIIVVVGFFVKQFI